MLVVEREPRDVYRTVTDRQLELAVPQAHAVGEYLHVVLSAARRNFLRAGDRKQRCHHNVAAVACFVTVSETRRSAAAAAADNSC